MKELCWFQARPLCHLVEQRLPIERNTKSDPILWLDRLAAIFRYTTPDSDHKEVHPCLPAINEMWTVLSNVCNAYQQDARIMERCCRCLRFAVRCLDKQCAHILEPLVKQVYIIFIHT